MADEIEQEEGGVSGSDLALIGFVVVILVLNVTALFTQIFGIDTALLVTLVGGYGIFAESLGRLRHGKLGGDLAVTIAAFAALGIGQYTAAAEVVLIMLVGTALESFAVQKTRGAIAALLRLSPAEATVLREGQERRVPVEEVAPGDRIIIRPGERIPVDGTVCRGQSEVNQAALTGESLPVVKGPGDAVYTGAINQLGLLEVEARAVGEQTTLAQIIRLVEEAEAHKAPVERLADRWAGYFVPVVVGLGAMTFLGWYALAGASVETALTRMASALIIACPCAMILATPTAMAAALGACARRGILFRGGVHLETLARVDCVVFDKTGTLTEGRPRVVDVTPAAGSTRADVLSLAAMAEAGSNHPIALALLEAAGGESPPAPERAEYQPGLGVTASLKCEVPLPQARRPAPPAEDHEDPGDAPLSDERVVRVGSRQLLAAAGLTLDQELESSARQMESRGQTAVFVVDGESIIGVVGVQDTLRPEAPAVIGALKHLGIRRILMLTGDSAAAAAAIARQAGIEEVEAGLFPAGKTERVRRLQAEGFRVAMLGDGINDAPSLAAANVGIAMGRGAADVAVDAADVIFTTDDLGRLPEAIGTGRRALQTVRRSILWFALGLNGLSVIASASGFLAWLGYRLEDLWPIVLGSGRDISPVLAAVEHQIASLLVVTNSLRLLRSQPDWRGMTPALPAGPVMHAPDQLQNLKHSLAAAMEQHFVFITVRQRWQEISKIAAAVAAAAWLLSGVYTIPAGQVAVVQLFGRLSLPVAGPGLHYHAPWPIQGVRRVDVAGVRRVEIGFRTSSTIRLGPGEPQAAAGQTSASEWNTAHGGAIQPVVEEAVLLTGDEYLVDSTLTLQYRVADPVKFLFGSGDPDGLVRQAAETSLRRSAGRAALESLLTTGRQAMENEVVQDVQSACDGAGIGVQAITARVQEMHPPREVVAAYRDVSSASEEKATAVNTAEAYRNETVPRAHGEAAQRVAQANGYTEDRIHRATGDAGRFVQMESGYATGRDVNGERLYLESAEQALATPSKFVMDPGGAGRRQLWLSDAGFLGLPGSAAANPPSGDPPAVSNP